MRLDEYIEDTLDKDKTSEAVGLNVTDKKIKQAAKSVEKDWRKIYIKLLKDIDNAIMAVKEIDLAVGGTSMIDDIERDKKAALIALNRLDGTLGSALYEYKTSNWIS